MDYLKNYNLNENDINEIINNIDEKDALEYDVHEENITKILDYFVNRKINIKSLLMNKPYIFYTKANIIIQKLNDIDDKTLMNVNNNVDLIDELL